MNVNDTPRTDAALKEVLQCGYDYKVKAEFARQLERELNDAKRKIGLMYNIVLNGAQLSDRPKGSNPDSLDRADFTHFDHPDLAITCREVLRELQRKSL